MRILFAVIVCFALSGSFPLLAEKVAVAAASDLKFAMDEIVGAFRHVHPEAVIEVTYGSSGKMCTQIVQGAPYDIFFSADVDYLRQLRKSGHAASEVLPLAIGCLVLWSANADASKMRLEDLARPDVKRIAIANPRHAPYGKRAEEVLRHADLWERVRDKLVYGENIAQTMQFVRTGNADVGIIALSLVLSPELKNKAGFLLIPQNMHSPLEQGYIITRRAAGNLMAGKFAAYMFSAVAREIMIRYGFIMPEHSSTPDMENVAIGK